MPKTTDRHTKVSIYRYSGILSLVAGYAFYLIFRNFDPLLAGLESTTNDRVLPALFQGSLASLIHVAAFSLISLSFVANTRANVRRTVSLWLVVNLTFEFAQGSTLSGFALLPGTYDTMDILFSALGALIVFGLCYPHAKDSHITSHNQKVANRRLAHVAFALFGVFSLSASMEPTYEAEPVYLSFDELRQPLTILKYKTPVNRNHYLHHESLLFINERGAGIHVYQTAQGIDPLYLMFLEIPGNQRMHISNGYLYADNFVDLLVIDISDKDNFHIAHRVIDMFPNNPYQVIDDWISLLSFDSSKGVVVDYQYTSTTQEGVTPIKNDRFSLGGLTSTGNILYAQIDKTIIPFNIENPLDILPLAWIPGFSESAIQEMTPVNGKLFIQNIWGRYFVVDPESALIAKDIGTYFLPNDYTTVGFTADKAIGWSSCSKCNEMGEHIAFFNIDDLNNPIIERQISMKLPYSLSLTNDYLFACHSRNVLSVNRLHNDGTHETIDTGHDIFCSEVSTNNESLFVHNERGIAQYNYSVSPFQLEGLVHYFLHE